MCTRWRHNRRPAERERGDTLLEVLAAVAILGVTVAGISLWTANATLSARRNQEQHQALLYAKAGIESARAAALAAFQAGKPLPTVSPPTLPAVNGVAYQEAVSGPKTPLWDNNPQAVPVESYTVTVTFVPPGGAPETLKLTAVIDPAVGTL